MNGRFLIPALLLGILLAVAGSTLMGACASMYTPPEIVAVDDPYKRTRVTRLSEPLGLWSEEYGIALVQMEPIRMVDSLGRTFNVLRLVYSGRDWLFIEDSSEEQSLIFIADGQRIALAPTGEAAVREVGARGALLGALGYIANEEVFYPLPRTALTSIAYADSVGVRIYGQNRYVERTVPPPVQALLQRWLNEVYVE